MPTRIINRRMAGDDHAVLTVKGGDAVWRRFPCEQCPWRKDCVGVFPPEAFCHSANTAYDMATHSFGCHMSGSDKPATCAGFLLRGAAHNLSARLHWRRNEWTGASEAGLRLHASYRAMAVANGVDPDDPALARCRDE